MGKKRRDEDKLTQRHNNLLDRIELFADLFGLHDFEVDKAGLPPPLEMTSGERILFLGSNPSSMGNLQLNNEYTAISKQLQDSPHFELFLSSATTRNSIGDAIAQYRPHIIHFAGHGIGEGDGFHKGGIVLEDVGNKARADVLSAEALAGLIVAARPAVAVRLVVLNACESSEHARVIADRGLTAIGMREEVADGRAIAFASGFYRGLVLEPGNTNLAFGMGVAELAIQGLSGAAGVPVVFTG